MIDKSCAILNEISIKVSLSHKYVAQYESCSLSMIVSISINFSFQYQYKYQDQDQYQEKKIQE